MRKSPRVSVFRFTWMFWVGAVATGAACSSDDGPETRPVASAGAAGTASTDTGSDAGVSPAADDPDASSGAGNPSEGSPDPNETSLDPNGSSGLDPSGSAGCTPGETRECALDLLCTGVETCGDNGIFGACECASTPLVSIVGASCASDTDCTGGATCLRADSNDYLGAGGPAGGYCSFSCTREADDCASHDAASFCAPLGPDQAGYCIRTCLSQDPLEGEAKCLNRTDVACISVAADGVEQFNGQRQPGYCRPLCGSDAECPAGRVCHAQAHICTDAQIGGAPIGASCSLDSDCSGYSCEDRNTEGVGVCTATCVLGSLSGCGFARDADRGAGCLTPLVAFGRFSEGVGDLGLCRELCDTADECEQAGDGWICTPLSAPAVEFFGKSGACVPG